MIWLSMAGDALCLSSWLWQHHQELGPLLHRLGDVGQLARAALADPIGAVRRAGNTVVVGQPDGGSQVVAFIEQTSPRVEHIEQAVSGLQAGQGSLSLTLGSLQTVSMVTVGLTAITPLVLGAQFLALNRKLGVIQKQIAGLHKKFDAAIIAELKTGLGLLELGQGYLAGGDKSKARGPLTDALSPCLHTMNYFHELLGDELGQKRVNREAVRLLGRHLAVAVVGVASCQIGLGEDHNAFALSVNAMNLLRRATRRVFQDFVAGDPAPFLLPPMREHGVTIDFMARLFQQARDAGALDPAEDASASAWFEEHRQALFRARPPRLGSRGWYESLKARLREAVAAVEETNRVVGLSRLVEQVRGSGRATWDVMEEVRHHASDQGPGAGPYLVWGLA